MRSFEYSISLPAREKRKVTLTLADPIDAIALNALTQTIGDRLPIMGRDTRLVG